MKRFEVLHLNSWDGTIAEELQIQAVRALEGGKVLFLPTLAFDLHEDEKRFITTEKVDPQSKNISYDPKTGCLNGTLWEGSEKEVLKGMIQRYFSFSTQFLGRLIPHYQKNLVPGKTSYRPVEISGRKSSYRKDDTRLHVDSFPSNPTKGRRILRVFTNINPDGKPRVWRLGEPFADVAAKFLPQAKKPLPGLAKLYRMLGITKDLRTPYDHYMLKMHNQMKADIDYQVEVSQEEVHFPPGCTWIVYTDQVSHAAMSGQYVLEQTFHLPVHGLKDERTAPVRVLERTLNRALV